MAGGSPIWSSSSSGQSMITPCSRPTMGSINARTGGQNPFAWWPTVSGLHRGLAWQTGLSDVEDTSIGASRTADIAWGYEARPRRSTVDQG